MLQDDCRSEAPIERLLAGQLPAAEQAQLELHVERCSACRERLKAAAASPAYWSEAGEHLRDDPLDTEPALAAAGSTLDSPAAGEDRIELLRIADHLDPSDDPRMLGRFGGYEVAGIIGCGGMGVVLKGYEPSLDRYVAIKVLAPHLAASGAARRRFAREARAAAAVLHENVVAIHKVAEAGGLPYLVMPYLAGDSLQRRLDHRGPLEVAETLRIGRQIAAGLAAAHDQGLVHRDIKPANILLDKGVERVTITDFGLARAADDASLTRSGIITGTPQYMSPEQAEGKPLDARSDLFSLGSVLYALCTGRPPFRAETPWGVLRRITDTAPRPIREIVPETPDWLCEIIDKLHAQDADERFGTAAEVAELLERWLAHLQQPDAIPAPPRIGRTRPVDGAARRRNRRRLWWTAACAPLVLLTAAVAAAVYLPPREPGGPVDAPLQAATSATERSSVDARLEVLMDEASLLDEYARVAERLEQLERQWHAPAADGAGGDVSLQVERLRSQLRNLAEQMDLDERAAPKSP